MIYTVTFNPAIDYVVRLDTPLEVGEVNRAKGEDCVLGGKGINGTRRWALWLVRRVRGSSGVWPRRASTPILSTSSRA